MLLPITQVVEGIFKIGPLDTHCRTPWTSPHLVMGEERAAILEPGEDGQAADLLQALRSTASGELAMDLKRIAYLIPTHIHLHHVAGANVLLGECPNAKVVVHWRGAPHLMEPTRLNESTSQVWGEGCPQIDPIPEDRIMTVSGGEVIDLGGRQLEIIETTGHAPHHISIFDRLTRTLFPGDAAGALYDPHKNARSRPDILPPLFDVEKAVASVRRLRALNPALILRFGYNCVDYSPDKTLEWVEKDIRAVERICREGMQQKISSAEIGQRVVDYYKSVGVALPSGEDVQREAGMPGGGGPIGMYRYLIREDPSLEMPR
ncbi:MAG: MBL fold metallo-hydrolase [Chloroflexi bacterium]|nr:MBL fold metallo-hydrolase [Chloroflexota bacterium]MBI3931042.1 MBL fold metallo-hydrolase [Chloroflexota bacterium]